MSSDTVLSEERLRETLTELCGDEFNGGLIRDTAFTVWSNCHHPTHEDGNSDWGNDNLPLVNVANERVRDTIRSLITELLAMREADGGWNTDLTAVPRDRKFLIQYSNGDVTIGGYLDNSRTSRPWQGIRPYESGRAERVGDKIVAWRGIPAPDAALTSQPTPVPLTKADSE